MYNLIKLKLNYQESQNVSGVSHATKQEKAELTVESVTQQKGSLGPPQLQTRECNIAERF